MTKEFEGEKSAVQPNGDLHANVVNPSLGMVKTWRGRGRVSRFAILKGASGGENDV